MHKRNKIMKMYRIHTKILNCKNHKDDRTKKMYNYGLFCPSVWCGSCGYQCLKGYRVKKTNMKDRKDHYLMGRWIYLVYVFMCVESMLTQVI